MSRGSTKVCAEPGCPNLRPCPTPGHTPPPWAGSTRRASLPRDWPARRQRILTRDHHTCTNCGWHDPTDRTLECDHIGNRHDHSPVNLTTLCGTGSPHNCHRTKTNQQAAAARRGQPR